MAISESYAGNIVVVQGPFEYSALASGALAQGCVVEPNTAVTGDEVCVKLATVNSSNPIGYVDSDWEANDKCVVYTGGIARLLDSGSGVTKGQRVICAANGTIKTYASGTTAAIVGIALETISASTYGRVFVNISYNTDVA